MKKGVLVSLVLFVSCLSACGVKLPPEKEPSQVKTKLTYKDFYNHASQKLSVSPNKGDTNLLVIPVWFSDSSTYILETSKENVRDDIQKSYFGTTSDVGWESVSSFYKKDSFNKVSISGTVSEWYECGKSSTYYYTDSNNSKTVDLVFEAVNWYEVNNPEVDMKQYDKDSDGYLDGVMLIYAAPDTQAMSKNNPNMWAYCYWTESSADVLDPQANVFFWASYDFMYDSVTAKARTGKTSYAGGYCKNGIILDTHTYIHEMGHVFGLDDYYDYADEPYLPAGGFSMQDYNVGAHDPFSRLSLGWLDAYVPTESSTFVLKPVETSGQIVVLGNSYDGSPFNEYIILELYSSDELNYQDSRYPYGKYPTGPLVRGVRIWHVDARLIDITDMKNLSITTDIKDGHKYYVANNNTSSGKRCKTTLAQGAYNLNQLIKNDTKLEYNNRQLLSSENMFHAGDIFSLKTYQSQFYEKNHLNNGEEFRWTVRFNSANEQGMSISCILD